MRVVVDAMVWISALRGNPASASRIVYDLFRQGIITVITCGWLLDEVSDKLLYLGVPARDVEDFTTLVWAQAEVIPIHHQLMGSTDLDDNPLLEVAINGRADFLVTRDKDLLQQLPPHAADYYTVHGVTIMPPDQFVQVLRANRLIP